MFFILTCIEYYISVGSVGSVWSWVEYIVREDTRRKQRATNMQNLPLSKLAWHLISAILWVCLVNVYLNSWVQCVPWIIGLVSHVGFFRVLAQGRRSLRQIATTYFNSLLLSNSDVLWAPAVADSCSTLNQCNMIVHRTLLYTEYNNIRA